MLWVEQEHVCCNLLSSKKLIRITRTSDTDTANAAGDTDAFNDADVDHVAADDDSDAYTVELRFQKENNNNKRTNKQKRPNRKVA